jgi:hypothetical protein
VTDRRGTRTPAAGIPVPRTVTPADEVLAASVARVRAAAPDWEIADAVIDVIEAAAAERRADQARIDSLEKDRDIAVKAVKAAGRWAKGSAGAALAAIATALWFAIGKVDAAGEARGIQRAAAERQLEDRQAVRELGAALNTLARDVAELRGRIGRSFRRPDSATPDP